MTEAVAAPVEKSSSYCDCACQRDGGGDATLKNSWKTNNRRPSFLPGIAYRDPVAAIMLGGNGANRSFLVPKIDIFDTARIPFISLIELPSRKENIYFLPKIDIFDDLPALP